MMNFFEHVRNLVKKKDDRFLNEEQIVDHLLATLTHDQKAALWDFKKESLIKLHLSAGMFIRNEYKLWHSDNPYTSIDEMADNHPDQMSHRILEKVWTCLHENEDGELIGS